MVCAFQDLKYTIVIEDISHNRSSALVEIGPILVRHSTQSNTTMVKERILEEITMDANYQTVVTVTELTAYSSLSATTTFSEFIKHS